VRSMFVLGGWWVRGSASHDELPGDELISTNRFGRLTHRRTVVLEGDGQVAKKKESAF